MAGVSHGNLDKAKKIMESADEETKDQLRRGEMSIHRAYSALTGAKSQAVRDTQEDEAPSKPVPVKKPECGSLLNKPVFEHYEPPAYMAPIPFEPIVPPDSPVPAPANESNEAEEDIAEPVSNPIAERVREIGQVFLDRLDVTLKGLGREDAEQIFAIVEEVGEKAVQTVKKYLNEHQEEKRT